MRRISAAELTHTGYGLEGPFCLPLGMGATARELECQQVLRWLPGRRLVARTGFNADDGRQVAAVLKLFLGSKARHYRTRELRGLERLVAAGARVPELICQVDDAAQNAFGLIFRFIPDSNPVSVEDRSDVELLVGLSAGLHQHGVLQRDLKLDNFLRAPEGIWMIDGDGVIARSRPLSSRESVANLSAMLAEQPPRWDGDLSRLGEIYCEARGWQYSSVWQQSLQRALNQARQQRLRRYARKTLRNCSEFVIEQHKGHFSARRRDWQTPLWEVFTTDPDRVIDNAELIKAGNSATLVRWRPQSGPTLVIKRYNLKSTWHGVRRALAPEPRYRRAWTSGQLLSLLDIPTAQPFALLQRRRGVFQTLAYLVMPDLGERELRTELDDCGLSPQRAWEVAALFASLRSAGLRHGDTKASNFVLSDDRVHCVDLDAVSFDRNGWRRDVARFLDNWDEDRRRGFELAFADLQLLP